MDLISKALPLPAGELRLLQPSEGAELPDAGAVEWAPVAPYWMVLWRSGVALAREVSRSTLAAARVGPAAQRLDGHSGRLGGLADSVSLQALKFSPVTPATAWQPGAA